MPEVWTADALQGRIDSAQFGAFQVVTLFMTGGIMFAEGAEMLVMGSITTLLHDHWDLSAVVRGLMVSIVFCGFSLGNLLSGYIGDTFGRRPAILLAYLLIGSFGFLTGAAWSPAMMILLRFFVGVGCGIGFPSVYSLIPEVVPTALRGVTSTVMIGFMPLGELFAAIMVLVVDPNLEHTTNHCELGYHIGLEHEECSWRVLCVYSAIPAFVFLALAALLLYESPHFLCGKGRWDEMKVVLKAIEWWNGVRGAPAPPPTAPFARQQTMVSASDPGAWAVLTSPTLGATTAFMCLVHFTKDFSLFGLAYVFPQYFMMQEGAAAKHLIITALLSLPGVLLAVCVMRSSFGHILALRLAAGSATLVAIGMLEVSPSVLAIPCAYCLKFMTLVFFIIAVIYTAEVFPSKYRNRGVGLCTCVGRLGSISAPLIFELSLDWSSGSFDIFIMAVAAFMAIIAATAGLALTLETKGQALALGAGDYGSTSKGT